MVEIKGAPTICFYGSRRPSGDKYIRGKFIPVVACPTPTIDSILNPYVAFMRIRIEMKNP